MKTKVIFKKVVYAPREEDEQAPTEIVAIFVDERENNNCLSCYAHLGQHSAIHESCLNNSKDATYEEYIDLYNELVDYGYKLSVLNLSFAKNNKSKERKIYEQIMKLAYDLEDRLCYDETQKGREWGRLVTKLQNFKADKL